MKEVAAWTEHCKSLSPAMTEACTRAPLSAGPAALVKELAKAVPEWQFRHALCRGGWYRLGGVVDEAGSRVCDNLEAWAESALEENGGDIATLAEAVADKALFATRRTGRTHYLVAPAGDGTADFLQLEIEEL